MNKEKPKYNINTLAEVLIDEMDQLKQTAQSLHSAQQNLDKTMAKMPTEVSVNSTRLESVFDNRLRQFKKAKVVPTWAYLLTSLSLLLLTGAIYYILEMKEKQTLSHETILKSNAWDAMYSDQEKARSVMDRYYNYVGESSEDFTSE